MKTKFELMISIEATGGTGFKVQCPRLELEEYSPVIRALALEIYREIDKLSSAVNKVTKEGNIINGQKDRTVVPPDQAGSG